MTKWRIIIPLFVCLIGVILSSGCVDTSKSIDYSYVLELESNSNLTQFIYFPLILTQDLVVSEISEKIDVISGDGSISIIETEYGFAYNISFKTYLKLKIQDNKFYDTELIGDVPQLILSMGNETNNKYPRWNTGTHIYFVYSSGNETQIDFEFKIHSQPSDFDGKISIEETIGSGWSKLRAYKKASMI